MSVLQDAMSLDHPEPQPLFPHRIDADRITRALDLLPPGRPLILIDAPPPELDPRGGDFLDVRTDYLSALDAAAAEDRPVVYAVDQDDLGSEVVRALVQRRLRYVPAQRTRPVSYAYKDRWARRAIETEHARQVERGFAKFEPGTRDAENLCQFLRTTEGLPGAFVEVGCYLGSSGGVAMAYMAERGIYRPAWFFDVFEGFNYPAALQSVDAMWAETHATDGIERVTERLRLHARPERGRPVRVERLNIITDDLPAELGSIAVANLDVDMLEAVYAGLMRLAPRIVPGGMIVAEDPGHTPALIGAQAAVDMFLEQSAAADFTPIYLESGQYVFVRRA